MWAPSRGVAKYETLSGATQLFFVDLLTGTWDAVNLVTGGTSGATFTPSVVDLSAAVLWEPWSFARQQVGIGAVAGGPFVAGEIISGGTSSAVGAVHQLTATGAAVLIFEPILGQFISGEVITGATSGATATSSTIATQERNPALSFVGFEDGRTKGLRGARGKVNIPFKTGEPSIMQVELMGVENGVVDNANLTGIVHESTKPPRFLDAKSKLGSYAWIIDSIGVNLSNTLAARRSANDPTGAISVQISDRDWTAEADPEQVRKLVQPFHQDWFDNVENGVQWEIGSRSVLGPG